MTIGGKGYELTGRTADLAQSMFDDFIDELKRIDDENPSVPGRLDGPSQRLKVKAQKRYRQQLEDFVISNIGSGDVAEVPK